MPEFKVKILSERYPDIQVLMSPAIEDSEFSKKYTNIYGKIIGDRYVISHSFDLFCGKKFESEEKEIECSFDCVELVLESEIAYAEHRKEKFEKRYLKAVEALELEEPFTKYAILNDCIGFNTKTIEKDYAVFAIKTNFPENMEGRIVEMELWLNDEERERRIKERESK